MDRRLVIAAVLVLLLMTVALLGLGSTLAASGADPAPTHHGTMSGDFIHVPRA